MMDSYTFANYFNVEAAHATVGDNAQFSDTVMQQMLDDFQAAGY